MIERIREICELNGAAGGEDKVREYIKSSISADECFTDNLGNLIAFKRGRNTPKNKIMFAAHMDEVGFIITDIMEDGFLRIAPVGGINAGVVAGRGLVTENGVKGVVGCKALHQQTKEEREKAPDFDSLYFDIGALSREEAEKYVGRGDYAYFDTDFFAFGDGYVKGKAIDDRLGCLLLMDMINSDLEYDAWFAFTSSEEIGTHGARAAAFTVAPDIAFVIETTTACDIAGVKGDKRVCELGGGCVVSYMDRGTIYDKGLYSMAFAAARENNIPVQTKTLIAGGNDSKVIHVSRGGVRTCAMSVPCRNLHSPSCVMKLSDYEATKQLAGIMLSKTANL